MSEQAYWVPTVLVRSAEITSERLHGYEFSPIWSFIADQAWVGKG